MFVGEGMATDKIRNARDRIFWRSGSRSDPAEAKVGKEFREAVQHGVRGFTEGDDFHVGEFGEVAGPIVNANDAAGAKNSALHGERDVNGREGFLKNASGDLLGIRHDGSRSLKYFRIEHVGRALAAEKCGDVVCSHCGHF